MQNIAAFAEKLEGGDQKHVRKDSSSWSENPNKLHGNNSNDHVWQGNKPVPNIIKAYEDLTIRLVDEFKLLGLGPEKAEKLARILISNAAGDDIVTHVGDHLQYKKAMTSAHLKNILKSAKFALQEIHVMQLARTMDQFAKVQNAQNLGFGVMPGGPSSIGLMQSSTVPIAAEGDDDSDDEMYLNDPNNIEGQTPNDSVTPGGGPNQTGGNNANKEGPAFTFNGQPVYLNEDSDDD